VNFTLPFPPSANRYWRKTRTGKVYVSNEARSFRETAARMALAQGMRIAPGLVTVEMRFYRPADRGDTDNLIKISLDALNEIGWTDDAQVKRIEAEKFVDRKNPRLELKIVKWEAPCPK